MPRVSKASQTKKNGVDGMKMNVFRMKTNVFRMKMTIMSAQSTLEGSNGSSLRRTGNGGTGVPYGVALPTVGGFHNFSHRHKASSHHDT